jgi:hypothetical protein
MTDCDPQADSAGSSVVCIEEDFDKPGDCIDGRRKWEAANPGKYLQCVSRQKDVFKRRWVLMYEVMPRFSALEIDRRRSSSGYY